MLPPVSGHPEGSAAPPPGGTHAPRRRASVHIYRRYLRGPAGGQLHAIALAAAAAHLGYDVTCGSIDGLTRSEAERNSGLDLTRVEFVTHRSEDAVRPVCDLLVHVDNADLNLARPEGGALVGFVYVPFRFINPLLDVARHARNRVIGRSGYDLAWRRIGRYDAFWTISQFSRDCIMRRWHVDSTVLYPPLLQAPADVPTGAKRDRTVIVLGQIIPVKQQLELLRVFGASKLSSRYRIRVVGSSIGSDPGYLAEVRESAATLGGSVELDLPRADVLHALSTTRMLWHGMGVGVDGRRRPEAIEHFGMAVLEAMAFGSIPIAASIGGPGELLPARLHAQQMSDFAAIAERIDRLIEDGDRSIEEELRRTAQRFAWPQFVASAGRLLDEVIATTRPT